jgi:hypothetical protein
VSADLLLERGIWNAADKITARKLEVWSGMIWLEPYARLWVAQGEERTT